MQRKAQKRLLLDRLNPFRGVLSLIHSLRAHASWRPHCKGKCSLTGALTVVPARGMDRWIGKMITREVHGAVELLLFCMSAMRPQLSSV
jgi:hypothetical protein